MLIKFLGWIALCCAIFVAGCQRNLPLNADTSTIDGFLSGSTASQDVCEQHPNKIWFQVGESFECVRYFPSADLTAQQNGGTGVDVAILYFHGDLNSVDLETRHLIDKPSFFPNDNFWQGFVAEKWKHNPVPMMVVGRPGVFGSSGYHGYRYLERNYAIMDAAIDAIKKRYGIRKVSLAGQSGGGTLVGALLARRNDVLCAAFGAAAVSLEETLQDGNPLIRRRIDDLFDDPINYVDQIPKDPNRRIFIVTDKRDAIVSSNSQKSYYFKLRDKGYHVRMIFTQAADRKSHSMRDEIAHIAAECVLGGSDVSIIKNVNFISTQKVALWAYVNKQLSDPNIKAMLDGPDREKVMRRIHREALEHAKRQVLKN